MFTFDLQCYGRQFNYGDSDLLYNMPNLDRYHNSGIMTTEITARCIKSNKGSLFVIKLFFVLQTYDYTLHYHKYTTSITQQKSITSTQNLLHKSFHQFFTKDLLIYPQTLTNNASTPSSFNMCKPKQVLDSIYILKILCHLLSDPHLMPQRALPNPSSKPYIKTKHNKSTTPFTNQSKTCTSQNHTPCIP